jgi:hypothetical protein
VESRSQKTLNFILTAVRTWNLTSDYKPLLPPFYSLFPLILKANQHSHFLWNHYKFWRNSRRVASVRLSKCCASLCVCGFAAADARSWYVCRRKCQCVQGPLGEPHWIWGRQSWGEYRCVRLASLSAHDTCVFFGSVPPPLRMSYLAEMYINPNRPLCSEYMFTETNSVQNKVRVCASCVIFYGRGGQLLLHRGPKLNIFRSWGPHINLWSLKLGVTTLHVTEALRERESIAPTHSRRRH